MIKEYRASFEKFKKLYFYRFLFIQILFLISFAGLLVMVQFLPVLKDSFIIYPIFILIGISAIVWFYSLGWYFNKKSVMENTLLILEGGGFVLKAEKHTANSTRFTPRSNMFIYNISNISNIWVYKRSIIVYGNISMEKYNKIDPKEMLAFKDYSQIKIPNYFEKQCIDDIKGLMKP